MSMNSTPIFDSKTIGKDLLSGLIVFLVALPLCLGIALASGAPLFSGLIAGIIGGIVVGMLSGSHTSVTGPAAGLTAIVAAQIATLGSFDAFLLAVVIGGILQIFLGIIKAGALSAFFPSSVIKGLLAAIGVILILKQIPHLIGHDNDPEGEMSFLQPDQENTFSEFFKLLLGDFQDGAMVIGLTSLALLILWDRIPALKKSLVPAPLVVVLLGVAFAQLFQRLGAPWLIESSHLVQVPVADSFAGFLGFLQFPDFSQLANPSVYFGGVTIAIVASLETLLNLDAVDKLDRKQRLSNPNRELWAQGVGNIACGMLGGLPVTSVIIRGSVNIHAGAQTKLSTIFHGLLLLVCVMAFPTYLNAIPLSSLAAILLMTGFKLASVKLFKEMWSEGYSTFLPFIFTLVAIVMTDLLIGILIGLGLSMAFILNSNLRRPIRRTVEKHIDGEVVHIELPNQVSFLNRASLEIALRSVPRNGQLMLDARRTDYIDPDILSLIREFKDLTAPVHGVQVSLLGFRDKYKLQDNIQFVDFATRELQERLTPSQVLQILEEGNKRFIDGNRLDRDLSPHANSPATAPHPMAVIFTGIDSRSPVEMIFDLGLGDVFSVRMPGNVVGPGAVGGIEFACVIGKVKLVLVMGHSNSRLVATAIEQLGSTKDAQELTGCPNLDFVLAEIAHSIDRSSVLNLSKLPDTERMKWIDDVSRRHVLRSIRQIMEQSPAIQQLVRDQRIAIVGAMYDVVSGRVDLMRDDAVGLPPRSQVTTPL